MVSARTLLIGSQLIDTAIAVGYVTTNVRRSARSVVARRDGISRQWQNTKVQSVSKGRREMRLRNRSKVQEVFRPESFSERSEVDSSAPDQ
jgi:hypothetical protein